jgi:hypothetical protein
MSRQHMKFIFIGGSGRSGTTFVQKLLLIHSKIAGGDEFDFLPQFMEVYRRMISGNQLGNRQKHFYTAEELNQAWTEFIESLFLPTFNSKTGTEFISEKTPDNIFEIQALLDLFPDAKFIFVYRDGRDVVNSFIQVGKRFNKQKMSLTSKNPALQYSKNWIMTLDMYNAANSNLNYSGRIYSLKYERLLTHPLQELTTLMSFIGLSIEPAQLSPSKVDAGEVKMFIDDLWYDKKMFNQDFNTENIGKWKKELNFTNKLIINLAMANRLKGLGYDVDQRYLFVNLMVRKVIRFINRIRNKLRPV